MLVCPRCALGLSRAHPPAGRLSRATSVGLVARRLHIWKWGVAILVVVAALAILTEAVDRGQSAANPCDEPAAPAPSVPLPQQKKASRVALRMPLVRQLLAGQSPNGIVVDEQGTRSGTLVGVQVEVRLGHPATSVR